MLEPGFFHLLAEKAESNACFSAAVQFLPNSTVGVAVAQERPAICPRSRRETLWLLLPPHWLPVSHLKAYIFLGHSRCKAAGRCIENGQKILTHVS